MVIWFLFLGIMGIINLQYHPEILKSFNPYYAYKLIVNSPKALWILGAVFLCTTGAEALYSDLGHCGAKNIRVSWFFVKVMLILNYLGQGSWLLKNYEMVFTGTNPFFGMLPQFLIIPAVILATAAAIIASQALITGSFTIFSEAMSLNFWPFQQIEYPSGLKGQMYIPESIGVTYYVYCGSILLQRICTHGSSLWAFYYSNDVNDHCFSDFLALEK
jgi:KUP system potassium uptake protein